MTVGVRDIQGEGFPDELSGQADSVFLDLPQPWLAIPSAAKMLQQDGVLCSFSPCIEQVQRSCETLKSYFTGKPSLWDYTSYNLQWLFLYRSYLSLCSRILLLADIRTFEVLLQTYEVREGNFVNWQDCNGRTLKSCKKRQRPTNGPEESKPPTIMARRNGETRGHTGYLTFARLNCPV